MGFNDDLKKSGAIKLAARTQQRGAEHIAKLAANTAAVAAAYASKVDDPASRAASASELGSLMERCEKSTAVLFNGGEDAAFHLFLAFIRAGGFRGADFVALQASITAMPFLAGIHDFYIRRGQIKPSGAGVPILEIQTLRLLVVSMEAGALPDPGQSGPAEPHPAVAEYKRLLAAGNNDAAATKAIQRKFGNVDDRTVRRWINGK